MILIYIVTRVFFAFGGRVPYSRALNAVLDFLHEVCDPYLRIFRGLLPSFGGMDFSPIIAVLTLQVLSALIAGLDG
jgi:YggT family protein